jgi:hypothetical protein
LSDAEGVFEERVDSVEGDQYDARDQAVRSLQPLPVGLVRISGVVSIIACRLGFGDIAIPLDPLQPVVRFSLAEVLVSVGFYIRPVEA